VHDTRTGKTERLASQAFQARPQGEVLALDLLAQQFPVMLHLSILGMIARQ